MRHCKLTGCPYDTSGKCLENQLPNCPNLTQDEAEDVQSAAPPVETERTGVKPNFISVYSGRKLTTTEAAVVFQLNPFVIVLGGMVESGKTTLIARIFEMFQQNQVDEYRFMTSKTPLEFARISWNSTMECGGSEATTEHTSRSENNLFLHLRIRPVKNSSAPLDFLFGDIPGELFPEAASDEAICRDLQALRRANHVVLFFDSNVLCDTAARHDHCGKIFSFLKMAMQTGQVGQHTVVHVIISKSDKLPKETTDEVHRYIDGVQKDFRRRFGPKVGGLHYWSVAARPEDDSEPTLKIINQIFSTWMCRATPHASAPKAPARAYFTRDFCRFGLQ